MAALQIVRQPQNQIVWIGGQASFSVVAKGAKKITYQWQKDGMNLSGQTKSTLRIKATKASDWGQYSVLVSSGAVTLESQSGILAVQDSFRAENEDFEDPDSIKGILLDGERGYGSLFPEISTGALRFQYSSGITFEEDTSYWIWKKSPQRKQSFDVRIDGNNSTRGKLQFWITCPDGLTYKIQHNGSLDTFNAGSWASPQKIASTSYPTSSTQFSFRVAYDAASKVRTLKAYYDEDGALNGENWVLLQTVKNPSFTTGRPILIVVCYNNNESGDALDGNNVTADNFQAR
jgi:hypothetical protein